MTILKSGKLPKLQLQRCFTKQKFAIKLMFHDFLAQTFKTSLESISYLSTKDSTKARLSCSDIFSPFCGLYGPEGTNAENDFSHPLKLDRNSALDKPMNTAIT